MSNDLTTDEARVRLVLSRELETISTYEALAQQAQSPEVRDFFLHLAAEEKEHVAEAIAVLRRLDSHQDAQFTKDLSASHFTGQAAPPVSTAQAPAVKVEVELPEELPPGHRVLYAMPAPPSSHAGTLTVGALKRRLLPPSR